MEEMLSAKRPFHKAGPKMFLDKISATDWKDFIVGHFRKSGRTIEPNGLDLLFTSADLIPYDVQRIAHELWDYAELRSKRQLAASDVTLVIESLVTSQSTYYEADWERLLARQRATLQAVAYRGATEIYSQTVREEFRMGAASTVQKALQSLNSKDILDLYKGNYFFIDPLFAHWIRRRGTS